MFWVTAGSSLLLGVFCFVLPHTPAPAKDEPLNWRTLLMLDALRLFRKPAFAVFLVCSCLICVPLAYYFGLTAPYLSNAGFDQAASTMTIGQMSEIFFMLLIPFFFRRLGVKWMVMIGMGAWVLRYMLFSWGAPDQVTWMLFLGIAMHGICYDFFFVTGFMYADRVAPKEARSQTQSLLVFLTQGIGMYIGYQIAFGKFGSTVTSSGALNDSVIAAKGEPELTFAQQLTQMFSVDMPKAVDSGLLAETMQQWKVFWTFPAMLAGAVLVIFFLTFWDKTKVTEDPEEETAVEEG
jgi:Na+/melibiose symporter-like transporter